MTSHVVTPSPHRSIGVRPASVVAATAMSCTTRTMEALSWSGTRAVVLIMAWSLVPTILGLPISWSTTWSVAVVGRLTPILATETTSVPSHWRVPSLGTAMRCVPSPVAARRTVVVGVGVVAVVGAVWGSRASGAGTRTWSGIGMVRAPALSMANAGSWSVPLLIVHWRAFGMLVVGWIVARAAAVRAVVGGAVCLVPLTCRSLLS